MRRIVLDTSVVVAGLRTQLGAGNAVLRLVAKRRLVALATPPLFLEYEDVLKRPEHRLAHGLAPEAIKEFLAELAALIEPVEVHFQWRPQSRDTEAGSSSDIQKYKAQGGKNASNQLCISEPPTTENPEVYSSANPPPPTHHRPKPDAVLRER